MTLAAAGGPPGSGTGPAPLSALFSDRVGEEAADGGPAVHGADPLSDALLTLDSISAAELEIGGAARTVVEAPASGGACTEDEDEGGRPSASARREEILDAASSLIAERVYHSPSTSDNYSRVGNTPP